MCENCPSIIVVHNHPPGDPTPSPKDIMVTRELRTCAAMMYIEFLDHIVLGQGKFASLKDKGLGV
jgi:DNA repair protein RadC